MGVLADGHAEAGRHRQAVAGVLLAEANGEVGAVGTAGFRHWADNAFRVRAAGRAGPDRRDGRVHVQPRPADQVWRPRRGCASARGRRGEGAVNAGAPAGVSVPPQRNAGPPVRLGQADAVRPDLIQST